MAKVSAIVLAAGQGKRMQTDTAKQFLLLEGKPLVCYALEAFENCTFINEVVLVTNQDAVSFCETEIVQKYQYKKVSKIIAGGAERYDSVLNGLRNANGADYVFIHDGARPFLTQEILSNLYNMVQETGACVAAMPVKDTIKIVDAEGYSLSTPERKSLYLMQTPQVFSYAAILSAYEEMMQHPHEQVTDDAMVMETYGKLRVKMCPSDYRNIKITTPEDLLTASSFLGQKNMEKR